MKDRYRVILCRNYARRLPDHLFSKITHVRATKGDSLYWCGYNVVSLDERIRIMFEQSRQQRIQKRRVRFIFAWYDFWIGAFWDQKKKWLYVFPIPMFGVIIKFKL